MRRLIVITLLLALLLPMGMTATDDSEADPGPEKTMSFEFSEEDSVAAVRQVAEQFEIDLVIPESLEGTTTITLRDVTWREALEAILSPLGYGYREEGPIVLVENQNLGQAWATDGWLFGGSTFWKIGISGVLLVIAVFVICHVALFMGVLLDKPPGGTRFAPKVVWALFVLWGGVVTLVCYWLIHHSTLRREQNQ